MNHADTVTSSVQVRVDRDFRSLPISDAQWHTVAARGDTWTVFQEPAWQRAWWTSYGRGQLLFITAFVDGVPVLLAPLFVDGQMAFFVGSGGSDYLDFIGDVSSPGVLEAVVDAVRQHAPGLLGFRLYHVPASSRTGHALKRLAVRSKLSIFDEGGLDAPAMDLGPGGAAGLEAARKHSLVRHERALHRTGCLQVRHLAQSADILPYLDGFFAQHIGRWQPTPFPSLFCEAVHRSFYRQLVGEAAGEGWLRFSMVALGERPIAFHLGFFHRGIYLWYKPSFEIELARQSPGEVLLRSLLLEAVQEGARVFDFGLGDEQFKQRFSNRVARVQTWGLYPQS